MNYHRRAKQKSGRIGPPSWLCFARFSTRKKRARIQSLVTNQKTKQEKLSRTAIRPPEGPTPTYGEFEKTTCFVFFVFSVDVRIAEITGGSVGACRRSDRKGGEGMLFAFWFFSSPRGGIGKPCSRNRMRSAFTLCATGASVVYIRDIPTNTTLWIQSKLFSGLGCSLTRLCNSVPLLGGLLVFRSPPFAPGVYPFKLYFVLALFRLAFSFCFV